MLYEFIFEPAPRLRQHRRKVGVGSIASILRRWPIIKAGQSLRGATKAQGRAMKFVHRHFMETARAAIMRHLSIAFGVSCLLLCQPVLAEDNLANL